MLDTLVLSFRKIRMLLNDTFFRSARFFLKQLDIELINLNYPLISIHSRSTIVLKHGTLHKKIVVFHLKGDNIGLVRIPFARKAEYISLSQYSTQASKSRCKFPLSYVESDILPGEMPVLRVQSRESKRYNFVVNPKSEKGTVNLGIVDGYFHQILEFIPILIKFPSMRFILDSQYPEELSRLLDFFEIRYITKYIDYSDELSEYEWEKYRRYSHGFHRKPLTVYPDKESVLAVRNAIFEKIDCPRLSRTAKKILYVSRNADTKSRRVVNEEILFERLRKSSYELGVITPSRMKLEDCFREFEQADVIIGPHGGGGVK